MKNGHKRRSSNYCGCGAPISKNATMCRPCAARKREAKAHPPNIIQCKYCGKNKRVKPSRKDAQFCSRECQHKYHLMTCDNCGKLFTPCHPERSKTHTCSIKCRGEIRTKLHPKVAVICTNCDKEFMRYQSQIIGQAHFCSVDCHVQWWRGKNHTGYKSLECICEICGTLFKRTKSRVDKGGGKYCSCVCFSESQRVPGATGYRGPNWKAQRRKARHRDKYTCQVCGVTEDNYASALDVHHIVPFREFGILLYKAANRLSNLVSLCKSCHRSVEKGTKSLR